ncbi:MAG: SpoIIIAH-like family protein [Oscillospiraceae bacterium]|nr:SpoIIIAH-like family protein [Oscillospiraceae bacterium]
MHVLIGKRQIMLAALVVMLGLAVFVNWYYTNNNAQLFPEGAADAGNTAENSDGAAMFTSAEEEDEYFASVKLQRTASQSAAIEELEAVLASSDAAVEDVQSVSEKIAALTAAAKAEGDIESLVTAQLGGNCIAVIGDNSIDVIISPSKLNGSSVLVISDIINNVVGDTYENVRIAAALS